MNWLVTFAAVLAMCLSSISKVSADESPIVINAILSLSGPLAFLGHSEAQALQIVEKVTNQAGGIDGHPVHFAIADDTSSPRVGIQLANDLIAKHAPVFIGSTFGAVCNSITPLLKDGPVSLCLSPVAQTPPSGYTFSLLLPNWQNFGVGVRYLRERGWTRLAVITAIDATGQMIDQSMQQILALPENRSVQVVASEHFTPSDISVAAQIAHIVAAKAQAIIAGVSGAPLGTILHGLRDANLSIPVFTADSNMNDEAMTQYASLLPKDLFFASVLGNGTGLAAKGPIHDKQQIFYQKMRANGVPHPDEGMVITWDPAMIVLDAYRRFGAGMTAGQLHDYVEGLHDWTGIDGVYDFRDGGQRGLSGASDGMVFQWRPTQHEFVGVSKPGGDLP